MNKGVVVKSTGSWYIVDTKKERVSCRLKGKFRIKGIKSTNPVAVGDIVFFEYEKGKETGVITKIENRKNYIIRKSVNLSKQTHIIATNIDVAFLLITLEYPKTYTGFIDRFLATAEAYNIQSVLVFNKVDLHTEELDKQKEELQQIYKEIGYTCMDISALQKTNISQIKELMKNKVSLLSGHSGAGKSTLINAIDSSLQLKTGEMSQQHKQGQHTTTFAEMFSLPFGGYIIDTPGIKGFGVVDFEENEITDYFPEFFKLKSECKFNNCLHLNEPQCAIKEAVETGKISKSRYVSYLQILEGDESNYRIKEY